MDWNNPTGNETDYNDPSSATNDPRPGSPGNELWDDFDGMANNNESQNGGRAVGGVTNSAVAYDFGAMGFIEDDCYVIYFEFANPGLQDAAGVNTHNGDGFWRFRLANGGWENGPTIPMGTTGTTEWFSTSISIQAGPGFPSNELRIQARSANGDPVYLQIDNVILVPVTVPVSSTDLSGGCATSYNLDDFCFPNGTCEADLLPGDQFVNSGTCAIAAGEPDEVIVVPDLDCGAAVAVTFDTPVFPVPEILYHYWGNCAPLSPFMPSGIHPRSNGFIQQMFCATDAFGLPAFPGGLSGETGVINFLPESTTDVGCNGFAEVGTCNCGGGSGGDELERDTEIIQLDFWLAVPEVQAQVGFRFSTNATQDAASFFVGPGLDEMCEVAYFADGSVHDALPDQLTGTYNIDNDIHSGECGVLWMRVRIYINDINDEFAVNPQLNAGNGWVDLNGLFTIPASSALDNTPPIVPTQTTTGYFVDNMFFFNGGGAWDAYGCNPMLTTADPGFCDEPSVGLSKNELGPDSQTVVAGSDADFTITVVNNGNENLCNVVLTDAMCDVLTGPTGDGGVAGTLELGETWTYTCTVNNVTTDFTNIAMITAEGCTSGISVSDDDPSDVIVVVVDDPSILVSKNAVGGADSQTVSSGSDAVFTITILNDGTENICNVVLTDAMCDVLTGPTGDGGVVGTLDIGEAWTYMCTVNNVTADFTNIAMVIAEGCTTGTEVEDEDPSDVIVLDPSVDVSKGPEGADSQTVNSGSDAVFTITILNDGNEDMCNVVLTDAMCDLLTGPTGDAGTTGTLEIGETWTYTCTVNDVTADFTNVAMVTAEGCTTGTEVEDEDPSDVIVDPLQCDFTCISQINLSLNDLCQAEVTPESVFLNSTTIPGDIILTDEHGDLLPSNIVDISYLGQNLTYEFVSEECNNSCWGHVLIEYKFLPIIDCPDDIILTCTALETLPLPNYHGGGNCIDSSLEFYLASEVRSKINCGDPEASLYTHDVIRTYEAKDSRGNKASCTQNIKLARIDLSAVQFPSTPACISCSDENYIFDSEGVPLPWVTTTGSGTASGTYAGYIEIIGVPVICEPSGLYTIANSICGSTGSGTGSGTPLIPSGGASILTADGVDIIPDATALCNAFISYEDQVVKSDCKTKIYRTWQIAEWYCGTELSAGPVTQLIEVKDNMPPTFDCPTAFTINTAEDCGGNVDLPSLENLEDQCGHGTNVKIFTSLGSIETNGGNLSLEAGENIVEYVVSDNCYNSATCEVIVTLQDLTMPVAICDQRTVVSLNSSGVTNVYASTFDDGSWDECGIADYEVRRMASECSMSDLEFGPSVSFCCADVGAEVMVIFRALDAGGNASDCMVTVEVQDKTISSLACPLDLIVECRSVYDPNNLALTFGTASVSGICSNNQIPREIITSNLNQCGVGIIKRLFEIRDGEMLLAKCEQLITFEDLDPFGVSDIVWPLDYSVTDSGLCSGVGLDPQSLSLPYAYPTFPTQDEHCALLGYDYEDTVITSGPCAKIKRQWTVIDWCNQKNGEFVTYPNPNIQILELKNTTAPIVNVSDNPVNVYTSGVDCLSGVINISANVITPCLDGGSWNYTLINTVTNTVVDQDTTSTYTNTLPAGNYQMTWTFTDGCNLANSLVQDINISSNKPPTPVCMSSMTITLDGGVSQPLTPIMLDAGSYHICGHVIIPSFSSDGTLNSIIYTCAELGDQTVEVWIIDTVNNTSDFCTSTITVEEGNSNCTPQRNLASVSGEIWTEDLQSVEEVVVSMGEAASWVMTNADGQYAFGSMPMNGQYEIKPEKDIDHLNGVSTLDLILIQRHILGLNEFESPYKYIAADIDNNQTINGIDIVELRKLILGVYSEFPSNKSWRFIDSQQDFQQQLNPWLSAVNESYQIESLSQDMSVDFIGVKIGDVNGSVISNYSNDMTVTRSQRWPLVLEQEILSLGENEVATLKFYAHNYENISGWQLGLNYDNDLFDIVDVLSDQLLLESYNSQINSDALLISFSDVETRSFNDGESILEIIIRGKKDSKDIIPFTIKTNYFNSEAYRGYSQEVPVDLKVKQPSVESQIVSVIPNPWIEKTKISFYLSESSEADLEFYDAQGRLLYRKNGFFNKGDNSASVDRHSFSAQGIIYIRLVTAHEVLEYRMIRL